MGKCCRHSVGRTSGYRRNSETIFKFTTPRNVELRKNGQMQFHNEITQ